MKQLSFKKLLSSVHIGQNRPYCVGDVLLVGATYAANKNGNSWSISGAYDYRTFPFPKRQYPFNFELAANGKDPANKLFATAKLKAF